MCKHKIRAWKLIQKVDGIGLSRKDCRQKGLISSLNTKNNYKYHVEQYLLWREFNGLALNEQDKIEDLENFLTEISETFKQKTVESYSSALSKVFHKKLKKVRSLVPTKHSSRNYFLSEILLIIKNLSAKNALSVLICFFSGTRAHELATIRRSNEDQKSTSRKWRCERFIGLEDYSIYIVTGKGGLKREIAIPNELVVLLERRRRLFPTTIIDRGIFYNSYYDLGHGKNLSQAFTYASNKSLNWSNGIHGTRHSYAQNRFNKLINSDISYDVSMSIVSEELGHFRPNITMTYLR